MAQAGELWTFGPWEMKFAHTKCNLFIDDTRH